MTAISIPPAAWAENPLTGCWVWQRSKTDGYGRIMRQGKKHYAHRLMYEITVGPIPDGYEIDHECENRACVNPDHLKAKSHEQHRKDAWARKGKVIGRCINGHEMVGKNVYHYKGTKTCRTCRRAAKERFISKQPASVI